MVVHHLEWLAWDNPAWFDDSEVGTPFRDGDDPVKFVLDGRVYPYVRMTRRGKYTNKYAQRYLANQDGLKWQFKQQMNENNWVMFPERTPIAAKMYFEIEKAMHREDIDNLIKAVLDAAQGVVYKNDLWIDRVEAGRVLVGIYKCRVSFDTRVKMVTDEVWAIW